MPDPTSPLAPPPGEPPGGSPVVPKSPIGGPGGPGGSPMLSPGGGAGLKADATAKIKAASEALLVASLSFEHGSKEQNALLEAVRSLKIFGKQTGANMVPAGIAAMAQASKQGPPSAAPPPGMMSSTPPPPIPGGAEPMGAAS